MSQQSESWRDPLRNGYSAGDPLPEYGTACFLCHRLFADGAERTEEDVVPRWLTRRLQLGNRSAALPNGQRLGYGQRTVPCCFDCNQRMSREVERPVSEAFAAGFAAVESLTPVVLLLWLSKIYYGTRFRETPLRTSASDPTSDAMLAHEDLLARNDYLRRCILLGPNLLTLAAPAASILIFQAGKPRALQDQFDLFVSTIPGVDMIALRAMDTFVIAIFSDNGYWARHLGDIKIVQHAAQDLVLHPVQCVELMTWFHAEVAAYASEGGFDFITITQSEGPPRAILWTNFELVPSGAEPDQLRYLRYGSFMRRVGQVIGQNPPFSEEESAQVAAGILRPSLLLNVERDEPVQAHCFEPRCPGIFDLAGWRSDLPTCDACRASPSPLAVE